MKIGDYFIQKWRMRVAAKWIPEGSRVLDIGCYQGEFLKYLGKRILPSIGLDPLYQGNGTLGDHFLFAEEFHEELAFDNGSFDALTLLATIEHIQNKDVIAREGGRLLKQGGVVVITVPSIFVDKILSVLLFFGIVDGMSLEEHHGFSPEELPLIFEAHNFKLKAFKKFQLGLNNLYVFERL